METTKLAIPSTASVLALVYIMHTSFYHSNNNNNKIINNNKNNIKNNKIAFIQHLEFPI